MTKIMHHTQAAGRGIKIPKSSYNEGHDAGTIADVLTDHNKAAHDALLIDAATLEDSTKAQVLASAHGDALTTVNAAVAAVEIDNTAQVGEVKLFNFLQGDLPAGWVLCDGTNGTEDLTANNPSVNTVYIQYIGGEYQNMTARTINIDDQSSLTLTTTLTSLNKPAFNGYTITTIEDGTPFNLNIVNGGASPVNLLIVCTRTSDGTPTHTFVIATIADSAKADIMLTQYLDCIWTIYDADD